MSTSLAIALIITLIVGVLLILFNKVQSGATEYRKMLQSIDFDKDAILDAQELHRRFEMVKLDKFLPEIEKAKLYEKRLKIKQKEGEIAVLSSKIGGFPDIVENFPIDEKLTFICQINLKDCPTEEIFSVDLKGMLYFFLDAKKLIQGENDFVKVFHCENLNENIVTKQFATLADIPTNVVNAYTSISLPDCEDERICGLLSDYQMEGYFKVTNTENCHKIGGYPDYIQPKKPAEKMLLLLQLDTDETINMFWGEMGRLFVFISKEDLLAKDFSKMKSFVQSWQEIEQ